MTKFTEGPWGRNIKPARKYGTIYAGRNTHVCQLISQGIPDDELEANADLIAVAPEMFDIIKKCLKDELARRKKLLNKSTAACYSDSRIETMKAIINKAEGKLKCGRQDKK